MKQSAELSAKLKDLSRNRVQRLVDNFDLMELLMDSSRLGGVDRSEFEQLVKGKAKPKPASPRRNARSSVSATQVFDRFTPVDQYADRILARCEQRGWGFDEKGREPLMRLAMNREDLREHAGPLEPTGVKLWLGPDLAYNWAEALAWLKDELVAAGIDLEWHNYLEDSAITFYKGSKQDGKPNAGLIGLDFHTFWNRQNGVVPREVRPKRPYWPGLEVVWFLALNPQYCALMDGNTVPFLMAPGLVVGSGGMPRFTRNGREFYAHSDWADGGWYGTAMAAFRE